MKPTTKINVTAEHIALAVQSDRHGCAAALGLKAANVDLERIDVDQTTIRASSRDEQLRYIWPTPPAVQEHIDLFDRNKAALEPFEFTLKLKDATIKPVGRQNAQRQLKRITKPGRLGVSHKGKSTADRPLRQPA